MKKTVKLLLLLLTLLLFESHCRKAQALHSDPSIELAEFVKLPKIFEYDDFHDCRRNYQGEYAFCVVHARIVPDDSSDLWRNISVFSISEQHYDHARLERGVCIQDCENTLRFRGELPQTEYPSPYARYAQHARSCINASLKEHYNLEIGNNVKIYHCYTPETEDPPVDFLEVLFYVVVTILITCIIGCTIYDIRQRNVQGCPETYFNEDPKTRRERMLVSFSFPRNFCRLENSGFSQIRQDLQFLEALRFIQMLRVLFLHIGMGHLKVPQANTDYMEYLQDEPVLIFFIAEFQSYIQTFLSISGMLLTINFLEYIRKNPDFSGSIFWDKLKARLCRIVPAYAFVILVECSFLHRLLDGPIGQQFVGEAQQNCRRWWWANLLFFNNYVRTDQPCLIQSWYLAVDMQLFIYGLVAMMVIWRWPWTKKYIFAIVFTCAIIIPTLTTYVKDVTPAMTNLMKRADRYSREHKYHYDTYFPFEQNIGTYSLGMLAGFLYHRYRDSSQNLLKSKWFSVVLWVAVVYYFLCMSSVYWVLEYRDVINPILNAIYSTIFKHAWSCLTTILQLVLALASGKLLWKKFFSHPFFGVAGKLCYGFYLIHFTVIESVYGGVKAPVYSNERSMSIFLSQIMWWTLFFGTLLTVLVEFPANAFLKELLDRRKSNKVHDIRETQGPNEQCVQRGN